MKELISIIVPAYNQAEFLPEALESVLAQTHTRWECFIINDGSTDTTEKIAHGYVRKDARFKYVKKENGGLSSARNTGLDLANGDWIQFLDSDDYMEPQKIELSLNCISINPSASLIVTDFKMFVNDIQQATPAFCELSAERLSFERILFGWGGDFTIPIHCGLFEKKLFQTVRFNEHLKAIEDWIMWLDVFQAGANAGYLKEPLAYYRNNPASMTKDTVFVRSNLIMAYKHIIDTLPREQVKKFTFEVIDRLLHNIVSLENDLTYYKTKLPVKIERKIKDVIGNIFSPSKRR